MMRNVFRTIEHIERNMMRNLDTPQSQSVRPPRSRKPTQHLWRAADARPRMATGDIAQREIIVNSTLTARTVKVTIPLDPAAVLGLAVKDGQARVKFTVTHDAGALRADVSAKSMRRVQAAIVANGVENTFVVLQGKLGRGEILECGLTAQVKAPAAPAAEPEVIQATSTG
jgi:hypothetical protein